jgi:Raf kinase inhibitor-like YbhB/YbcL family protein
MDGISPRRTCLRLLQEKLGGLMLPFAALSLVALQVLLAGCGVGLNGRVAETTEEPFAAASPLPDASLASPPASPAPASEDEGTSLPATNPPLTIASPSFSFGEPIPSLFTCDGENISPLLEWTEPPIGTSSFALIADDPDAPGGTWVHWVLFNIPPEWRGLPSGIPTAGELAHGGRQGSNSGGNVGYAGPCPPSGTHRYFFKLYALDAEFNLPPGISKADLLKAMQGHVLAQVETMGTYAR